MPATAEDLRGLHELHRRARALRDRLESAPKSLAARRKAMEARQKALEDARAALKAAKAGIHKRETLVASLNSKLDDLRIKLNVVKKNEEYKAIQNQIAHDQASISRLEDEMLEEMASVESQAEDLKAMEAEAQRFAADVEAFRADVEGKAEGQRAQLRELETAIKDGESIIPAEVREAYRRVLKQRGEDAFAAVDPIIKACSGCYVSVTLQAVNDLINAQEICFCKTCGRVLYLAED